MKYETESAAAFWTSKINPSVGEQKLLIFQKEVLSLMCEKFALHWYEENPLRGQAFREISCDFDEGHVDSILLNAADKAGFSLYHCMIPSGMRMWVDPGEVEVAFSRPHYTQVVYQAGQNNVSPPLSPRGSSSVQYYDSLSYTEPSLSYYSYPDTQDYVFVENGMTDYDYQTNYQNLYYPVQQDVLSM